jgi:hypothetical protein
MGIVYGAPILPPPAPASAFHDLVMTWDGWDGSTWPLTDAARGVFLGIDGIEGLTKPQYTQWTQSSPSVAGQWFRGSVADPRKVFWPLEIYSDVSSEAWVDLEAKFWKTMRVGKYGTWKVTGPRNETRSLRCRFVDDGAKAFTYDPVQAAWAAYGVTLVADQPFWSGSPVSRSWQGSDPVDFFNGEDKATPFRIGSASTLANARITNPGDEPAWPVWIIIGDSEAASVGIGTSVVEVPFEVPGGKALVIDQDPTVQTAVMYNYTPAAGSVPESFTGGVDRTSDLGAVAFAPIPAGQNVPVAIELTGGGIIRLSITPLYERAW